MDTLSRVEDGTRFDQRIVYVQQSKGHCDGPFPNAEPVAGSTRSRGRMCGEDNENGGSGLHCRCVVLLSCYSPVILTAILAAMRCCHCLYFAVDNPWLYMATVQIG
jgi:hypothetical protein